jgi:hypothetical protein
VFRNVYIWLKCNILVPLKEQQIQKFATFDKIHEELHNLYSSPNISRIIKPRKMRWTGHVVRMWRRGMDIGYCWESQKARDHWEDQDVGGWTKLKWILER